MVKVDREAFEERVRKSYGLLDGENAAPTGDDVLRLKRRIYNANPHWLDKYLFWHAGIFVAVIIGSIIHGIFYDHQFIGGLFSVVIAVLWMPLLKLAYDYGSGFFNNFYSLLFFGSIAVGDLVFGAMKMIDYFFPFSCVCY